MIGRYLLILAIAFVLYWFLKGTLRRFLAPPRRRRKRPAAAAKTGEKVETGRRSSGIDYSKVRDADYRDL